MLQKQELRFNNKACTVLQIKDLSKSQENVLLSSKQRLMNDLCIKVSQDLTQQLECHSEFLGHLHRKLKGQTDCELLAWDLKSQTSLM